MRPLLPLPGFPVIVTYKYRSPKVFLHIDLGLFMFAVMVERIHTGHKFRPGIIHVVLPPRKTQSEMQCCRPCATDAAVPILRLRIRIPKELAQVRMSAAVYRSGFYLLPTGSCVVFLSAYVRTIRPASMMPGGTSLVLVCPWVVFVYGQQCSSPPLVHLPSIPACPQYSFGLFSCT